MHGLGPVDMVLSFLSTLRLQVVGLDGLQARARRCPHQGALNVVQVDAFHSADGFAKQEGAGVHIPDLTNFENCHASAHAWHGGPVEQICGKAEAGLSRLPKKHQIAFGDPLEC